MGLPDKNNMRYFTADMNIHSRKNSIGLFGERKTVNHDL